MRFVVASSNNFDYQIESLQINHILRRAAFLQIACDKSEPRRSFNKLEEVFESVFYTESFQKTLQTYRASLQNFLDIYLQIKCW